MKTKQTTYYKTIIIPSPKKRFAKRFIKYHIVCSEEVLTLTRDKKGGGLYDLWYGRKEDKNLVKKTGMYIDKSLIYSTWITELYPRDVKKLFNISLKKGEKTELMISSNKL